MIFIGGRTGAGCYNASVTPRTSATERSVEESLRAQALAEGHGPSVGAAPGGEPTAEAVPDRAGPGDRSSYIYIRREVLYSLALAVAFAIGLGGGYLIWGTSKAAPDAQPADTGVSRPAGRIEISLDEDPRLGPDDAPITIVEFSDFNCPFCRAWHQQTFPGLL